MQAAIPSPSRGGAGVGGEGLDAARPAPYTVRRKETAPMRYGFYCPTRGGCATAEAVEAILAKGEALGFSSTMIADHIVFPTRIASRYPYTVSGDFPGGGDALDQLSLLAFAAGRTRALRLCTSRSEERRVGKECGAR